MIDWAMIVCSIFALKNAASASGACIFLNKNLMQLFSLSKGMS